MDNACVSCRPHGHCPYHPPFYLTGVRLSSTTQALAYKDLRSLTIDLHRCSWQIWLSLRHEDICLPRSDFLWKPCTERCGAVSTGQT